MIDPVVVQFWTLLFDEVKRRQEAGDYSKLQLSHHQTYILYQTL